MAYCVNCGNQVEDSQRFCSSCGTQISRNVRSGKDGEVIKCPSCGAPAGARELKCPECGHEFRNRLAGKSINEFFEHYRKAAPSEKAAVIRTFPIPNTKDDILSFLTMGMGNIKGLKLNDWMAYRNRDDMSILGQLKGGSREGSTDLQYRQQEICAWRAKVRQVLDMGKLMFKDNESQVLFQGYEKLYKKELRKLSPLALLGVIAAVFVVLLFGLSFLLM